MSSIEIAGLTKSYGGQAVVSGIDLSIATGELMVLVGPSGCGKTTSLRIIAGLVAQSAGTIRIGDKEVSRLPPRLRNIGMVFQNYALFPSMTVRQNVAFGLEEHSLPQPQIDRRVGEMLHLIRMEPMAERLPRELSGGQQQRVALARALAYRPGVLLMDEPFGALDQKLRDDMQREFVEIQKQLGITTIFVTHDQQEAMAIADRICVMNAGRIEQLGCPEELYERPASLFVATFIGHSNQFPGRVLRSNTTEANVMLDSGEIVTARVVHDRLMPGDAVLCIVRPERLSVANRSDSETELNRIPITVQRRVYLGSFVEVIGTTSVGGDVVIQSDPVDAVSLTVPSAATITFTPSDTSAFRRRAL